MDKLNAVILFFLVAGGMSAGVGLSSRKIPPITLGLIFVAIGAGLLFGVR